MQGRKESAKDEVMNLIISVKRFEARAPRNHDDVVGKALKFSSVICFNICFILMKLNQGII
jgi:hypothetical protein